MGFWGSHRDQPELALEAGPASGGEAKEEKGKKRRETPTEQKIGAPPVGIG